MDPLFDPAGFRIPAGVAHVCAGGETPFLHVMRANEGAHGLYQRMGFRDHVETVVRVVSPV